MKLRFLNKIVIFIIVGLRPLFGQAHCKYAVSCTKFAQWQLQEKSLLPALWSVFKRICSCNPFTYPSIHFLKTKNTQDDRKKEY